MAPKNLALTLSVKTKKWRMEDGLSNEADAEFRRVRPKVLERDFNTCRFCAFTCKPNPNTPRANYYMQVHHRDDDHSNNAPENLVTACMHCHAVQHIGLWGQNDEAVLIWLPEIPQDALNHISRAILVGKRFHEKMVNPASPTEDAPRDRKEEARAIADACTALQDRLLSRTALAVEMNVTSSPADLASMMSRLDNKDYARRVDTLAGLRLLMRGPHVLRGERADIMPMIVDSWLDKGGPFSGIPPKSWMSLIKSLPPI